MSLVLMTLTPVEKQHPSYACMRFFPVEIATYLQLMNKQVCIIASKQ